MCENRFPSRLVSRLRLLVHKAGVSKPQERPTCRRDELYCYDRLSSRSSRTACDPCKLDQPMRFKSEKAPVMRMTFPFKVGLEKERSIHLRLHPNCSRRRKPKIKLFGPCSKQ